jgi:CheY-like chemotaxis protein
MGGEIQVRSAPQQGSCFWFELDLQNSLVMQQTLQQLMHKRILIVDSNTMNHQIYTHMLREIGIEVVGATNLHEALEVLEVAAIKQHVIDAAIIDYTMAHMSGLDVGLELKEHAEFSHIPLIIATASLDDEILLRYHEYAFDTYLEKPFNKHTLQLTLNRVFTTEDTLPEEAPPSQTDGLISMLQGKVLIVEDNEVNRLVAAAMLEQWQVNHVFAQNGKEAIEAWQKHQPDLILMDCQMPIMDGYESTRNIRRLEVNKTRVPIIALTANAMQGDRDKCVAAGMDDYLSKPFKENEIYAMLGKWLGKRTAEKKQVNTKTGASKMDNQVDYMSKVVLGNLQQFLNEEKLHTLLARYLSDSSNILTQLQAALASQNQEESRRLVHSLKSTSANVGAIPLSEIARELENYAREGQLDAVSAGLDRLLDCFAQTQASIGALEVMQKRKTG